MEQEIKEENDIKTDLLLEKVKPLKDGVDLHKKIFRPPYQNVLPTPPFRWLISGAGQSGKTTLLITILTRFFNNYFDKFYILSPNINTAQWERAIEKLGDKVEIFDDWNEETEKKLQEIIEEQKESIEENGKLCTNTICFVFDDMVDNLKFMNSSVLHQLYIRGRHCMASSIFCVQYYNGFPLKLRKNVSALSIFGSRNKREVEALSKEFCHKDITEKQFVQLFDHATSGDYSFLTILPNCTDSRQMYRKGFCNILEIKKQPEQNVTVQKRKREDESEVIYNHKKQKIN